LFFLFLCDLKMGNWGNRSTWYALR